jgi:hypothetical protein
MYRADGLRPGIMLSFCKNLGSIGFKAPGFILKLCSKRRNKKAFNPHHLPPYHPLTRFSNLNSIDRNCPADSCRKRDPNDRVCVVHLFFYLIN